MKKLHLKNLGVQEMDAKEMEHVDGGSLLGLFKGIVDFVEKSVETVYNAGSDIYNGFSEGYADGRANGRHN